jgi:hypothetical protein
MRRTILLAAVAVLVLASLGGGARDTSVPSGSARTPDRYERAVTIDIFVDPMLLGGLFAEGRLSTVDHRHLCETEQVVTFQRLVSGQWLTRDRALTGRGWGVDADRAYRTAVRKGQHPDGSRWRVLAPESTLPNGDVCLEAVSKVIVHPHAEDQR